MIKMVLWQVFSKLSVPIEYSQRNVSIIDACNKRNFFCELNEDDMNYCWYIYSNCNVMINRCVSTEVTL